jgi:hypothetical protein
MKRCSGPPVDADDDLNDRQCQFRHNDVMWEPFDESSAGWVVVASINDASIGSQRKVTVIIVLLILLHLYLTHLTTSTTCSR